MIPVEQPRPQAPVLRSAGTDRKVLGLDSHFKAAKGTYITKAVVAFAEDCEKRLELLQRMVGDAAKV